MINPIRRLTDIELELNKINMYPADYKGKLVLFDDCRIKLPEDSNLYKYEIREDDHGLGDPVELSSRIFVNFYGTIISDSEIELKIKDLLFKDYDIIEEDDFTVYYYDNVSVLDLLLNKQSIINLVNNNDVYQYDKNGDRICDK